MIQLNLLPNVKLEYIKAQRLRRLLFSVSIIVTIASVALLVFLFTYSSLQKKHLSDLNTDVTNETKKLKEKPQINRILTVQNQLESLTTLHAGKPAASKAFDYLNSVTPAQVSISNFTIDFTKQRISLTGASDKLSSVNQYVDTMKFTTYADADTGTKAKAFSNVVMDSFGVVGDNTKPNQTATYSVSLNYDPLIFDVTKKIDLTVPKITTTRSALDKPTDLFQASSSTTVKGTN